METSIIIPAYNEEKRIEKFLNELINYSKENLRDFEIIVVNDGSRDKTADVVNAVIKSNNTDFVKLVNYRVNMGKGYAVKTGVNEAQGKHVLFIDADGAIKPNEIPVMLKHLAENDVVIGNRKTSDSKITKPQPFTRRLASSVFNSYVNALLGIKVHDLLCGFKGFKQDVAKNVFANLKTNRWAFDVEVLCKVKKNNYSVYQLPIEWEHKDDSKMKFADPLKILLEILKIRFL
ncbi:MAG: glycosyltransferase family 2 protein [Candidatus ainarchaeum sp.]|nr:glycosyltransferase family 2 protein [Candidatus ainarchaeum sp.]